MFDLGAFTIGFCVPWMIQLIQKINCNIYYEEDQITEDLIEENNTNNTNNTNVNNISNPIHRLVPKQLNLRKK